MWAIHDDYVVPMRRVKRATPGRCGPKPALTAEQFADKVCKRMRAREQNAVVFHRDGEPHAAFQGSKWYEDFIRAPRGRSCFVGHYAPNIAPDELAADVKEYFQ